MSILYEEVYKEKREKYLSDGDLFSFNQFISSAHEFQFAVVTKEKTENFYIEWLKSQKENS